jgi:hypothetical protein
MTRDKLEKTCVACYAIFTYWVFPKITIFEYPANSKSTTYDLSSDVVVYKMATSMFPTVKGEGLISLFENEDAANTKTDDNDAVKLFREYLASKNIKPFQKIDDLIVKVEE